MKDSFFFPHRVVIGKCIWRWTRAYLALACALALMSNLTGVCAGRIVSPDYVSTTVAFNENNAETVENEEKREPRKRGRSREQPADAVPRATKARTATVGRHEIIDTVAAEKARVRSRTYDEKWRRGPARSRSAGNHQNKVSNTWTWRTQIKVAVGVGVSAATTSLLVLGFGNLRRAVGQMGDYVSQAVARGLSFTKVLNELPPEPDELGKNSNLHNELTARVGQASSRPTLLNTNRRQMPLRKVDDILARQARTVSSRLAERRVQDFGPIMEVGMIEEGRFVLFGFEQLLSDADVTKKLLEPEVVGLMALLDRVSATYRGVFADVAGTYGIGEVMFFRGSIRSSVTVVLRGPIGQTSGVRKAIRHHVLPAEYDGTRDVQNITDDPPVLGHSRNGHGHHAGLALFGTVDDNLGANGRESHSHDLDHNSTAHSRRRKPSFESHNDTDPRFSSFYWGSRQGRRKRSVRTTQTTLSKSEIIVEEVEHLDLSGAFVSPESDEFDQEDGQNTSYHTKKKAPGDRERKPSPKLLHHSWETEELDCEEWGCGTDDVAEDSESLGVGIDADAQQDLVEPISVPEDVVDEPISFLQISSRSRTKKINRESRTSTIIEQESSEFVFEETSYRASSKPISETTLKPGPRKMASKGGQAWSKERRLRYETMIANKRAGKKRKTKTRSILPAMGKNDDVGRIDSPHQLAEGEAEHQKGPATGVSFPGSPGPADGVPSPDASHGRDHPADGVPSPDGVPSGRRPSPDGVPWPGPADRGTHASCFKEEACVPWSAHAPRMICPLNSEHEHPPQDERISMSIWSLILVCLMIGILVVGGSLGLGGRIWTLVAGATPIRGGEGVNRETSGSASMFETEQRVAFSRGVANTLHHTVNARAVVLSTSHVLVLSSDPERHDSSGYDRYFEALIAMGVRSILCLASQVPDQDLIDVYGCDFRTESAGDWFPPSHETIVRVAAGLGSLPPGGAVAVHCGEGWGRSGTLASGVELLLSQQSRTRGACCSCRRRAGGNSDVGTEQDDIKLSHYEYAETGRLSTPCRPQVGRAIRYVRQTDTGTHTLHRTEGCSVERFCQVEALDRLSEKKVLGSAASALRLSGDGGVDEHSSLQLPNSRFWLGGVGVWKGDGKNAGKGATKLRYHNDALRARSGSSYLLVLRKKPPAAGLTTASEDELTVTYGDEDAEALVSVPGLKKDDCRVVEITFERGLQKQCDGEDAVVVDQDGLGKMRVRTHGQSPENVNLVVVSVMRSAGAYATTSRLTNSGVFEIDRKQTAFLIITQTRHPDPASCITINVPTSSGPTVHDDTAEYAMRLFERMGGKYEGVMFGLEHLSLSPTSSATPADAGRQRSSRDNTLSSFLGGGLGLGDEEEEVEDSNSPFLAGSRGKGKESVAAPAAADEARTRSSRHNPLDGVLGLDVDVEDGSGNSSSAAAGAVPVGTWPKDAYKIDGASMIEEEELGGGEDFGGQVGAKSGWRVNFL